MKKENADWIDQRSMLIVFIKIKTLRAGFEPTIHKGSVNRSLGFWVLGPAINKTRDFSTQDCSRPTHYQST